MQENLFCKLFYQLLWLLFYCRRNRDGLPCTSETAKKMSEMTHWQTNIELYLEGIPEVFNVADFCELINRNIFQKINIKFASNISSYYYSNFHKNFEGLKKCIWN